MSEGALKWLARRVGSGVWSLALPVALLLGWWFWSAHSSNLYFPPLEKILRSFGHTWFGSGFGSDVLPSLRDLALGYVIGVGAGVILGVVVGRVRWVRWLLSPLISYGRSLPPPALLPFALLVLGIGAAMQVAFIAFGVVFVVLLNTIDGVLGIDPSVEEYCRVYRVPRRLKLPLVILPAASPQIMIGMRTGLSLAVLLMVVGEMTAATGGIGYFTVQAEQNFAYVDMWSGVLLLAVIGVVLNLLFQRVVERPLLFWHGAGRGPR